MPTSYPWRMKRHGIHAQFISRYHPIPLLFSIKIPLNIHIMIKQIPINFQDYSLQAVNASFRIPSNFHHLNSFKIPYSGKIPLYGKIMG